MTLDSGFDFYYKFKVLEDPPKFIKRVAKNLGLPNAGPVVVFPENALLVATRYLNGPRHSHAAQRAFFRSEKALSLFRKGDQIAFPYSKQALLSLINTQQEIVAMGKQDLLVRVSNQTQAIGSLQASFLLADILQAVVTGFIGLGSGSAGHAATLNGASVPSYVKTPLALKAVQKVVLKEFIENIPKEMQAIYYGLFKIAISPAGKGGAAALKMDQMKIANKKIAELKLWTKERSKGGAVLRNTLGWLTVSRWSTFLHQSYHRVFSGKAWDWNLFFYGPEAHTKDIVAKMIKHQNQQMMRSQKVIVAAKKQLESTYYSHILRA